MRHVAGTPFAYDGVVDCLVDILEHDGVFSLVQGLTTSPFVAIWSSFGRFLGSELVDWATEHGYYKPTSISTMFDSLFRGLCGTVRPKPDPSYSVLISPSVTVVVAATVFGSEENDGFVRGSA